MKQLGTEGLIEYIKHAIDLESAVAGQNAIIQQYEAVSKQKEPVLKLEQEPQQPFMRKTADPLLFKWGIIITIIGVLLFLSAGLCDPPEAGIFTGLLSMIFGIGFFCVHHMAVSKDEKIYGRELAEYTNKRNSVLQKNKQIQAQYYSDKRNWDASNNEALAYLNGKLHESEATVQQYYSADVVFPKYRNLPALTMIYEYLTTGRCSELTGPNGAYNLYESELRQNTIISQMSVIISKLDEIKYNQYILYETVVNIQRDTRTAVAEISAIRGYTYALTELAALNTYYNGIAAQSASAMAYYQALN